MNNFRCARRFCLTISLLLAATLTPAGADSLRAYDASYDFFQGGMHIANTRLSLARNGDAWEWRMLTEARGMYSLFTSKRPVSETRFSVDGDSIRLQRISVGDEGSGKTREQAQFDWNEGRIDVRRKGKSKTLKIDGEVYDFQSIHLLAARMYRLGQKKRTVDFYRKGKLVKSQLVFGGNATVVIKGNKHDSLIFEQIITRSDSKIRYYYDAGNPLLPLRIEKLESGESPSVMQLESVKPVL